MYSKIPMPKIEWDEKSMKYVMCFFPLVGLLIGAVMYAAASVMLHYNANPLLFAAVMSVIPIIITGGIHLDGFIDTADALSSYGDKDKKLEIMKDPHVGAFAIIWTAVYFVLSLGIWSTVEQKDLPLIAAGFVMSRALSGMSVICFKCAKNSGLAYMFKDAAHKKRVRLVLMLWLMLVVTGIFIFDIKRAAAMFAAAAVIFLWHYYNCRKNFGGITGDLAGCFLVVCEMAIILSIAIVP